MLLVTLARGVADGPGTLRAGPTNLFEFLFCQGVILFGSPEMVDADVNIALRTMNQTRRWAFAACPAIETISVATGSRLRNGSAEVDSFLAARLYIGGQLSKQCLALLEQQRSSG